MKQIEFQNFKKAPHPFEEYGNLPPAAFQNRFIPQRYVSLPQGKDGFINKIGKKQFENKHQSSIKEHWLGQIQNDSLSKQIQKYHQKIKGKSLETKDIEGAQGGSLKSPAVKNKQKAQQLKKEEKINGFNHDYEKEQYKMKIQNAVKSQYQNDIEIGKLISWKGHGHVINPEKKQSNNEKQEINFNNNSKQLGKHQHQLKEKYGDFQTKNQKYKQFFNDVKTREEGYTEFFNKYKNKNQKQDLAMKAQPIILVEKKNSKDYPTPKITSKEHEDSIFSRFRTIQIQNDQKTKLNQLKKYIDKDKEHLVYQPPNFFKKSIQSQFRQEYSLDQGINMFNIQSSLADSVSDKTDNHSQKKQKNRNLKPKMDRAFNPTHLSNIIGPGYRSDVIF